MEPTYRQLLELLKQIPDERLDDNIAVYDKTEDEYHPVTGISIADNFQDVLDAGHVVLTI